MEPQLQLLEDLRNKKPIKIKVFNLGENLGMDFAYFAHYYILRKYFPVEIHLYRSNVDETNCIGFDNYKGKVVLPVDNLVMQVVKQRYPDGTDWAQRINQERRGEIFPESFITEDGYDYIWGIGYGGTPVWKKNYTKPYLEANQVLWVIEKLVEEEIIPLKEYPILEHNNPHIDLPCWERTLAEYLCYHEEDYPFTFTDTFSKQYNTNHYKDYIRVGLRWPDHVRWYYSIDRQYECLIDMIEKLREQNLPIKLIYNLKDGEVGNNFNRGQTLDKLKMIQDLCDDCIFTYSWTIAPYFARKTEQQELDSLKAAGIKNVMKLDLWEDLLISKHCGIFFADPSGFSEIIGSVRRSPETTFLFPVADHHLTTHIVLNQNRQPIIPKVHPITIEQSYTCKGTLSSPDDPEGYRTLYWTVNSKSGKFQIGENNHGDDWKYFQEAQKDVFKKMYKDTKDDLVNEVVKQYKKRITNETV